MNPPEKMRIQTINKRVFKKYFLLSINLPIRDDSDWKFQEELDQKELVTR